MPTICFLLTSLLFIASIPEREALSQKVPGTVLRIELAPVPGDGGEIEPFWLATTEVPWEVFDAFVFQLDKPHGERQTVTETRPTKPYTLADRGYGHNGYPALSMSFKGAQAFCTWLSEKTGRTYRLPTEAEWEHACHAAGLTQPDAPLAELAWFKENSERKTRPVGKRRADELGIHDLFGNVAEWCVTPEGGGVVRGGSFRDATLDLSLRLEPTPDWNATDPQLPKSPWWLADADFVGFRLVCEGPATAED